MTTPSLHINGYIKQKILIKDNALKAKSSKKKWLKGKLFPHKNAPKHLKIKLSGQTTFFATLTHQNFLPDLLFESFLSTYDAIQFFWSYFRLSYKLKYKDVRLCFCVHWMLDLHTISRVCQKKVSGYFRGCKVILFFLKS